jgi:hypothetical protein
MHYTVSSPVPASPQLVQQLLVACEAQVCGCGRDNSLHQVGVWALGAQPHSCMHLCVNPCTRVPTA